jgi:Flp pilus assembly protein TadG
MTRRRRDGERGQSLVEMALVLPIFFLFLFGIFDFGFAFFSQMSLMNAAQEAAHAASVHPDRTTIGVISESRARASGTMLTVADLTVDAPACVPIVSNTCNFASSNGAQRGDVVRVTVHYVYRPFFPLLLGRAVINLTSTAQATLQ